MKKKKDKLKDRKKEKSMIKRKQKIRKVKTSEEREKVNGKNE